MVKIITTRPNGSKRVQTVNDEPSKTDQQFKDDCDVNFIIDKFTRTGQLTHVNKLQGQYADVSEMPDLPLAMETVTKAQQTFDDLPAELRRRFGNSPVEMFRFLQDPKNDEEAIRLGLKTVSKMTGLEENLPAGGKPSGATAKNSKVKEKTPDKGLEPEQGD